MEIFADDYTSVSNAYKTMLGASASSTFASVACFEMLPFYCAEAMLLAARDAKAAANTAKKAGFPDMLLTPFFKYSDTAKEAASIAAKQYEAVASERGINPLGKDKKSQEKIDKAVKSAQSGLYEEKVLADISNASWANGEQSYPTLEEMTMSYGKSVTYRGL